MRKCTQVGSERRQPVAAFPGAVDLQISASVTQVTPARTTSAPSRATPGRSTCDTGENTEVTFAREKLKPQVAAAPRAPDAAAAALCAAKVPCAKCNKLFNNAWFLHLHELRAHGGGGGQRRRRLPCPRDDCDKQFRCRFALDSHVLGDHEGKRPFSCAVAGCHRSFAMKVTRRSQSEGSSRR